MFKMKISSISTLIIINLTLIIINIIGAIYKLILNSYLQLTIYQYIIKFYLLRSPETSATDKNNI